jgi:hypothetical protein
MNKMQKLWGKVMAGALIGVFAVAQPAAAQSRVAAPPASPQIVVDLGSSAFQVTGTVTTTTGVTSTADLTGTTAATSTGTTTSGSVLLPATGADLSQQQRNVNMEIIPLLMLLSGIALLVAVGLMSLAQRDYRRQNDDQ